MQATTEGVTDLTLGALLRNPSLLPVGEHFLDLSGSRLTALSLPSLTAWLQQHPDARLCIMHTNIGFCETCKHLMEQHGSLELIQSHRLTFSADEHGREQDALHAGAFLQGYTVHVGLEEVLAKVQSSLQATADSIGRVQELREQEKQRRASEQRAQAAEQRQRAAGLRQRDAELRQRDAELREQEQQRRASEQQVQAAEQRQRDAELREQEQQRRASEQQVQATEQRQRDTEQRQRDAELQWVTACLSLHSFHKSLCDAYDELVPSLMRVQLQAGGEVYEMPRSEHQPPQFPPDCDCVYERGVEWDGVLYVPGLRHLYLVAAKNKLNNDHVTGMASRIQRTMHFIQLCVEGRLPHAGATYYQTQLCRAWADLAVAEHVFGVVGAPGFTSEMLRSADEGGLLAVFFDSGTYRLQPPPRLSGALLCHKTGRHVYALGAAQMTEDEVEDALALEALEARAEAWRLC